MFVKFLQRTAPLRKIIYKAGRPRAGDLFNRIKRYLNSGDHVIDIGSGTCHLCELVKDHGMNVTSVDVINQSFVDGINPILYDGKRLPFTDNAYDTALIITVLHHTLCPEEIIQEAKRVARKIIIIEDIYTNRFHKYWTFFWDSLFNLEFTGHPHTNKTDQEWRSLFHHLGLELKDARYQRSFLVFKHATYCLHV